MAENQEKWSNMEGRENKQTAMNYKEFQDSIQQYLKHIAQNLLCEVAKKNEIVKELESDIQIALEQGESWEDIQKRMGTPEEIAEEFNDNFSENYKEDFKNILKENSQVNYSEDKRHKKAGVVLGVILAICAVVVVALAIFVLRGSDSNSKKEADAFSTESPDENTESSKENSDFKENGNQNMTGQLPDDITTHSDYDEEAVVEQTKKIISLVDAGDCETLRNEYTAEIMLDMMEQSQMDEAKKTICADWGSFLSYGNFYTSGVEQAGEKFVVVQVNVSYENANVTFAITLDEEMKLAGIYMM